jgi:membrane associated rhomboid family serine protease
VALQDPNSVYVIGIIVAVIVVTYLFALWRGMSFTAATVIANVVVFVIYSAPMNNAIFEDVVRTLGFDNTSLRTGEQLWGLFTHMYIHANFLHVFFNMFILFIMGIHFEDRVGWKWMAIVYWGTGVLGGALVTGYLTLPAEIIGIGASGAISGVLGAFAIMYPWDRVPMVIIFIILPRVQVAFGALVFILFQTFLLMFAVQLPGMGNVSYMAHLAGAMVGVAFGYVMMRMGVEKPTPGSRLGKRLDNLDYTPLGDLAYSPANKERYQALVAEDIPEVKEVLLEDLVSRLRCPRCSSIITLKGTHVRCEGCDWRADLRRGRDR